MCNHAALFQLLWSGSHNLVYDLAHEIALSSNKDLGVSAHMRGPTRVYAARIFKVWMMIKVQLKA